MAESFKPLEFVKLRGKSQYEKGQAMKIKYINYLNKLQHLLLLVLLDEKHLKKKTGNQTSLNL